YFSSRRRHTRSKRDWSSDVCSSDLVQTFMKNGASYPKALSAAYEQIGIKNHHVTKPNNILGFHYIKTISDYNLSIEPYTIKRIRSEERRVGKESKCRKASE